MGFKPLLGALLFFLLAEFVFVCIGTAIIDWSKSEWRDYGIWRTCEAGQKDNCPVWNTTEQPLIKDCEGALLATRAFSVMSIIFVGFCMILVVLMLAKPAKFLNKNLLLVNLCMQAVTNLWLFLGWIMYLGVPARGHCSWDDRSPYHLGSSWFLQLFAWITGLISIVLAFLLLSKWNKTPKYVGGYPAVAGGPVPYGAPAAVYPQKGGPYKPSYYAPGSFPPPPAPYMGSAGYPAAYGYGPTPTTSPYLPTPYY